MEPAPNTLIAKAVSAPVRVGQAVVDPSSNTITAGNETVTLEPRVMDLLCVLAAHPGEVLTRDALINAVWKRQFGADESLTRAVSLLRKAFRSCGLEGPVIETVPKRGYRLAPPVGSSATAARSEQRAREASHDVPVVAVAPFETLGTLPHGLDWPEPGREIADGLSRFSYLKARWPADGSEDCRFRLEGSMHHLPGQLRVTARLFDRKEDTLLWSRRYDRPGGHNAPIAEEIDEICAQIIASIADPHGRLMAALFAELETSDATAPVTGHDAVVRTFLFKERVNAEDHLLTREALDRARAAEPRNADVWAASGYIALEEYKHDFNPLPDSRDRALAMTRRAVEIDPRNAFAQFTLSETHFFRQEFGAFKSVAEKAISLNPYDSDAMAMIGIMMFYGNERERGVELAQRGMALNPDHPGWYRFAEILNDVIEGQLDRALEGAERVQMPTYYADAYVRTVVLGLMGRTADAQRAASEFLALWGPDLPAFKEKAIDRWVWRLPELERLTLEGLAHAGIDLGQAKPDA